MMLKILVFIMIMMRSSVVVKLMASKLEPSVQFSTEIAEVEESDGMVSFLVIRSGNLSFWTVVRCYTTQLSAFADEDFIKRPQSEESEILFSPGEKEQTCSVVIIDDFRFEGDEIFALNLGLPEPSEDNPVKLGENSVIRVRISDVEDASIVQLEMESYSIKVSSDLEDKLYIMLSVVRSGDLKVTSSVRINTRDETAKAGIDYIPVREILNFELGVAVKLFRVEILRNEIQTGHRTFVIILDNALNAILGVRSSASISISDNENAENSLILPSSPVVVSLMYYDDAVMGSNISPSPGYPLVCISPCDFHHPKHESLKVFCADFEDVEMSYIWEVADSTKSIGEHLHYEQITLATPFTTSDTMVLDSVYFRSNFVIRCVAQPWKNNAKGIPLPSEPVTIDAQKEICHAASFEGIQVMFQSQAFTATLTYVDPKDTHHPNRVHIRLEIPHQDGMIPLISASPLPNKINLLSDAVIRRQHQCSNMFPVNFVKNQTGFLTASNAVAQRHAARPYQFDESMRGVETVLLYRHLDLDGCKWEFDGWFQMSELATSCGGIINSGSQRRESGKTYVTVKVPLYVSYISSMEPTGWRTIEHRTEMETSFHYNGILWKNAIQTENAGESKLQIKRVATRTDGRLLVEFQTKANFRGLYVMEHMTSDRRSQLLSRNALVTFNLSLLWSEHTFDGPIQRWKAISSHSLKDYTGKYNLELLPCIVGPKQVYSSFSKNITCRISSIQRFTVPIVFKQNPQPVSVVYSLNTVFQLLNNERIFLANPFDEPNNHWDMDFKGSFTKGDNVYGRVMWQADQKLDGAYKLTIQQVYICSGQSGYIPTFDPTGEMYNEGSHFGCLENNSKLKHRFLILDRSDSDDTIDKFSTGVPLKAKFASDDRNFTSLDDIPGVDGFSFQVDALYSVSAGHQWYLQVLYTIGPASRYKRSTLTEGKSASRNGTNMHVLVLAPQQSGRSSQKEQEDKNRSSGTQLMTVITTSLVVVCVVFLVAIVLCVVAWRRWKSLKRIEMRLRLKQVTTTSRNLNEPFGQSANVNSGAVRLNSQVRVDNAVVRTLPVKIHNNLSEGTEV